MATLPPSNLYTAIFPFCPGNAAFVERASTPPISASAREVRSKPRRNRERLMEFVITDVFVFIKQAFRSPDRLSVLLQVYKGKEAVGRSGLFQIKTLLF